MANQIMVINPYRVHGTWVFDDDKVELVLEPFVSGIPEIIDQMVSDIPNAAKGFRMLFSKDSFPGATQFDIVNEEYGGAWYQHKTYGKGWLCPAKLLYFPKPPKAIHVACEPAK